MLWCGAGLERSGRLYTPQLRCHVSAVGCSLYKLVPPGLPDAPEDAGARLPAGGEIGVVEYVENRVSR